MNARLSAEPGAAKSRPGPVAYCVVGLVWFAFLMVAFRVPINEPVFLWALTQGLLMDHARAAGVPGNGRILFLAAYMGAGLLAWWLVERTGRDPRHVWRRAVLAWIGIQIVYCLTATVLVQTGILYE